MGKSKNKTNFNNLIKTVNFAQSRFNDYFQIKNQLILNQNRIRSQLTLKHVDYKYAMINQSIFKALEIAPPMQISDFDRLMTQSLRDKIKSELSKNQKDYKSYELFTKLDFTKFPKTRLPSPGINLVPLKYHRMNIERIPDEDNNTGRDCNPIIEHLIRSKYPRFIESLTKWCRPEATTEAVFRDFNRQQYSVERMDPERSDTIIRLIHHFFDTKPYRPLSFTDTLYAKLPLNTGTGYFHKKSYIANAHAKFSAPQEYRLRPTSKGYYMNFHYASFHTDVHNIKRQGLPFELNRSPSTPQEWTFLGTRLSHYFNMRPTLLYCRLQISKREGAEKKTRPVYGVDDGFLTIETMLTFPLIMQARSTKCAIMHSFETLRGANQQIDSIARQYKSYITLDYKRFDQTLNFEIINEYFTKFLPQLIICNQGNQPTASRPDGKPEDTHQKFTKLKNLLEFLHTWYINMTFLSADGFAYRRTTAGVPSGLLETQELDSFGNMYLILDTMLAYGFTINQILRMKFFVLGDDNSIFMNHDIAVASDFVKFAERYLNDRWAMTLSLSKCVITDMRNNIQTLSYDCNFGEPKKDIIKLCAQLCFPEHEFDAKYMSARSVGIAYAACGMDAEFHQLCRDIYIQFLPYAEVDKDKLDVLRKFQPGVLKTLHLSGDELDLSTFPDIDEVRYIASHWSGELPFHPKWDESYFLNPPNHEYENAITLFQYAQETNQKFNIPAQFM